MAIHLRPHLSAASPLNSPRIQLLQLHGCMPVRTNEVANETTKKKKKLPEVVAYSSKSIQFFKAEMHLFTFHLC